jgi:uncharacterized SAM-binding protein YcdF (DUF218 family)
MITAVARARQPGRRLTWLIGLPVAAAVVLLVLTCRGIIREAGLQELHPADAIVVFGAAEYSGRPSPVFRARLDHAFELFNRGVAPTVITSGGAAGDPDYNEGGVGRDYLKRRGIPETSLIAETQGADTAQSAQRIAVIMRANNMQSCVAVSDEYHVYRIRRLLEHEGVKVYVAPRSDSRPHSRLLRTVAVLREAVSYLLWQAHIRRRTTRS